MWMLALALAVQSTIVSFSIHSATAHYAEFRQDARRIAAIVNSSDWGQEGDHETIYIADNILTAHWFNRWSTRWQLHDNAFPQDIIGLWAYEDLQGLEWVENPEFFDRINLRFVAAPSGSELSRRLRTVNWLAPLSNGLTDIFVRTRDFQFTDHEIAASKQEGDRIELAIVLHEEENKITLPLNYMRGLRLKVNDRHITPEKSKEGWVKFRVPGETLQFDVKLNYGRTPDQWTGIMLSITSFVIVLIWRFAKPKEPHFKPE